MTWLFPFVLIAVVGGLVLFSVFLCLYLTDRKPYLGVFSAAWLVYLLGVISDAFSFQGISSPLFALCHYLAELASGFLLIRGMTLFMGKPLRPYWYAVFVSAALGTVGLFLKGCSASIAYSPAIFLNGVTLFYLAAQIALRKDSRGFNKNFILIILILWGLYKWQQPLWPDAVWISLSKHAMDGIFEILTALGFFVFFSALGQSELRDLNARLQAIMNSVEAHINVIDVEGTVLWRNRSTEGAVLSDIGRKCWELFEQRDARCPHCVHPDILRDGQPRDYEARVNFADGSYKDYWVHAVPLKNEAGQIYAFVEAGTNITQRKQNEEERRSLERQVQQKQKLESLGVLAGGIAHDFNNLLMAILGNIDLALAETPHHSSLLESLHAAEKASQRAAELCRQMLAYSGKGRFLIEAVDLNELAREMDCMLRVALSQKAVLQYNLDVATPSVFADVTQLNQVVMNLVINASEAVNPANGLIVISTGARRFAEKELKDAYLNEYLPPGEYVFLKVSDNGGGMSAETQAKIFDPFFTTKFTGRGLGLAAVQGIVRGHKGVVQLESALGKGTCFTVLLPASGEKTSKETRGDGGEKRPPLRGTVLVVDDEASVRDLVRRMLEFEGMETIPATSGQMAIDIFRDASAKIDCVLLDLMMPGLNGKAVFRELKKIRPDVRVILTSGYNEMEIAERFQDAGLAGFIQKPYRLAELTDKIREALCIVR